MADIEIVKVGLKYHRHRHEEGCVQGSQACPYIAKGDRCFHILLEDALSVINEQQAEIDRLKGKQPKKKEIWVIKKGNKYLHSYRAGRTSWTTKGSGISIWNSLDKSTADFFASAVNGIVVNWDGDQE